MSQTDTDRRIVYLVMSVLVTGSACLATVHARSASNCGGNSAALHYVREYALTVRLSVEQRPDRTFSLATASVADRENFDSIARGRWTGSARYLVSTKPVRYVPGEPPRVLIVCDHAFRNVPRRTFILSPPTHAVAYSDGTTELISTERFAALDLSGFIPLDKALAASIP